MNQRESTIFHPFQQENYKLVGEQYGYREFYPGLHVFGMNFKLIALKDSLPPFYLMSCSWGDKAFASDTSFGIGQSCDFNFLTQEQLNKNDTLELSTFILTQNTMRDQDEFNLKIALKIVDTIQLDYSDSTGQQEWFAGHVDSLESLTQNHCWSNTFQLTKLDSTLLYF